MRYKTEENPTQSVTWVLALALGLGLLCFAVAFDFGSPIKAFGQTHVLEASMQQTAHWALIALGALLSVFPCFKLFTARQVNQPTAFKCPAVPLIPIIAMAANMYMMVNLNLDAWLRLWIWLAIGLVIYAFYGRRHSKLN
jgi:APA family basic amino acid/polyamine antiporter